MTRFFGLCLLAWLACAPGEADARLTVSVDSLTTGVESPFLPVYKLRQGWRFWPRDDPAHARRNLDDSGWHVVTRPFPTFRGMLRAPGWIGHGWFRLRLTLTPELREVPLALLFSTYGASELYVDGQRVGVVGTVGRDAASETTGLVTDVRPVVVPVDPRGRGTLQLAVRFSNYGAAQRLHPYHQGFDVAVLRLADANPVLTRLARNRTIHQVFFGGSLATIALLHILLFSFYPRIRRNLTYGIYAACLALAAVLPSYLYVFVSDPGSLVFFDVVWKWTLLMTVYTGTAFLYDTFLDRPPTLFRYLPVPLVGLALLAWTLPLTVYYAAVLASFAELIRTVIVGYRNRREGAAIIGFGYGALVLSTSHILLIELDLIDQFFPYGYLYGFLALALSISLSLAKSFARTAGELRSRVDEVQALSERQVAQARHLAEREERRIEAERRRRVLEAENAIKQNEIATSRRRQQILEQLEETATQIQRTQGRLVQSEKMAALGNLVAGIAHEINTPVGAVNSMHDTMLRAVDRLRQTVEADEAAATDVRLTGPLGVMDEANRVIAAGTARVTEIVRSLRTFARLDDAEMRETDLHEGIDSTIPLIQSQLKQGITVEKAYGEIPTVTGYPSRLSQVFLNLLVNAAQAITGEGTITIRTWADGDRVFVAIEDTGNGIRPEHLPRVFDPGFTTRGVGVGTGLGLSICYQIVQDHGGEITIDSEEGKGTTVTVALPREGGGG